MTITSNRSDDGLFKQQPTIQKNEKVTTPSAEHGEANPFGCPHCPDGRNDGHVQVGFEYWYVCDIHRVKWLGWTNEWDWWSEELEAQWEKNHSRMLKYKTIDLPRADEDADPELVQDSVSDEGGDDRKRGNEFPSAVETMLVGTRLLRVR